MAADVSRSQIKCVIRGMMAALPDASGLFQRKHLRREVCGAVEGFVFVLHPLPGRQIDTSSASIDCHIW